MNSQCVFQFVKTLGLSENDASCTAGKTAAGPHLEGACACEHFLSKGVAMEDFRKLQTGFSLQRLARGGHDSMQAFVQERPLARPRHRIGGTSRDAWPCRQVL